MSKLKTRLHVSPLTGKIHLVKVNDKGIIDGRSSREDLTIEATDATLGWFRTNKHRMMIYESAEGDYLGGLFYTDDEEKAEQIMEILGIESENEL